MAKSVAQCKIRVEKEREFLSSAPELAIALACIGLVDNLRCLESELKERKIASEGFRKGFNVVLAQLTRTAEAAQRFDIVLPVMDYGQFSPFFWSWFNWWKDYLEGLTPRQAGHLVWLAREKRPSLKNHRPKGDWLSYRRTPAFALVAA